MSEYIPYSIRNNIADPELAGLLDYLEREIGWEIKFSNLDYTKTIEDMNDPANENFDSTVIVWRKYCESWMIIWKGGTIMDIDNDVFLRTYKTILPVIRDLYSK